MFEVILIKAAVSIAAVVWAVASGLHVYRLARYYQLEGYDSRRYLRWFFHHAPETTYAVTFLAVLFLAVIAGLVIMSFFAWAANQAEQIVELGLIAAGSIVLAAVAIRLRPREREIKQTFTRTQRAMRLVVTALILVSLPALMITVWVLSASTLNDLFEPAFASIIVGIITLELSPVALPLANLIMWPVEETFRRYYLRLAKTHLKRSGATVIAITGSYGKTSTKHYLQHMLDARYRVLMTPKSYNTLLGVSRVINEILANDASYDYFIVEAGAYIPGEIAAICRLVEPQISLVTAVGPMHLERFGSMENIIKAKYEIVQALPAGGLAVFNGDDPNVRGMAERGSPQNRITVTRQGLPGARLSATNIRMTVDGLDFDVCDNQTNETRSMHALLYGEHNVSNILMAAAVARHLGLSLGEIGMRVATLQPAEHRLSRRLMPDGTVLIDDAYSANPVGTKMALEVLALHQNVRRIVVSSGMFELGPISDDENRKLGERIADVATDVILIGSAQTKPVQEGLNAHHFPADHMHIVETLTEAVGIYRGLLRPGDVLLILTDLPDTYAS